MSGLAWAIETAKVGAMAIIAGVLVYTSMLLANELKLPNVRRAATRLIYAFMGFSLLCLLVAVALEVWTRSHDGDIKTQVTAIDNALNAKIKNEINCIKDSNGRGEVQNIHGSDLRGRYEPCKIRTNVCARMHESWGASTATDLRLTLRLLVFRKPNRSRCTPKPLSRGSRSAYSRCNWRVKVLELKAAIRGKALSMENPEYECTAKCGLPA